MTCCLLFVLFNFCTTWLFPFLPKNNNKKQQLNSCFRCNCMPYRNTVLYSSALGDNIILHTMNFILSVSVCEKIFLFFFLIIIFTSCGWRMCWIMYWWLQTIRNTIFFLLKTIWENVSSSVCYAQVLFLSFAFQKMYVNIYMENNEATPTISDKWCFVKML